MWVFRHRDGVCRREIDDSQNLRPTAGKWRVFGLPVENMPEGGLMAEKLQVILELVTGQYKREAQEAATATGKLGQSATTSGSSLTKLAGSAATLGANLTTRLTLPIVAAGGAMVKAASDLSESMNAVGVVFEDARGKIDAFGETAAETAGLSTRAFNEAVIPIGALLKNFGFSVDESADSVLQLTQRAADLGSTLNMDTSVALDKFRSGLSGEAEPLKAFGVDVSVAALKTEALSLGLIESGQELDRNARAQAAFSIIMRETNFAAGDFAKTFGESLPNQLKALKADAENIAASLGQSLLPMLLELASSTRELVGRFKDLSPEMRQLIVRAAGIAAAAGPVLFIVGKAIPLLNSLRLAVLGVNAQLAANSVITTTRVVPGLGAMTLSTGKATDSVKALGAALGIMGLATAAIEVGVSSAKDATDDWTESQNIWQRAAGGYIDGLSTLKILLGDFSGAVVGAADAIDDQSISIQGTGTAISQLNTAAREAPAAMAEVVSGSDAIASSLGRLFPKVSSVAEKYQALAAGIRAVISAQLALVNPVVAAVQAQDREREAGEKLEEVRKDSESTTRDVITAELDLAVASAEAEAAQQLLREQGIKPTAEALSDLADESLSEVINKLRELELLDEMDIRIIFDLDARLSEQLQSVLPYLEPGGSAAGGPSTPGIFPRQHGGPIYAGTPYLVGEKGPEIMWPSTSGTVMSNADMRRWMEGAGRSVTINLASTGNPTVDFQLATILATVTNMVETQS
jgi:hypothetical protein